MGLFNKFFDLNGDGELDSNEEAMGFAAFASIMDAEEEKEDLDDIDIDDLEDMDEDERREALEDAGLDPDDYDL